MSSPASRLDSARREAVERFGQWRGATREAQSRLEAKARDALEACYAFGLLALDEPEAFDRLCQALGVPRTRANHAANPFIRVVKAAFGASAPDAGGAGRESWRSINPARIMRYATVLRLAHQRAVSPDAFADWLSRDYTDIGMPVPMSINRRLREARRAFRDDAGAAPALPEGIVEQALDALGEVVPLTPLTVSGMGDGDGAALILALPDGEAVRVDRLEAPMVLRILEMIRADAVRGRSAAPSYAAERGLGPLFDVLAVLRRLVGPRATWRVVNQRDHCSVLASDPVGAVARLELPLIEGLPKFRRFLFNDMLLRMVEVVRDELPEIELRLRETNYQRPGGILEQRLVFSDLRVEPLPLRELGEAGTPPTARDIATAFPGFDTSVTLGRDGVARLLGQDRAARAWRGTPEPGQPAARASRFVSARHETDGLRLFMPRDEAAPVFLPALRRASGAGQEERYPRRALARAAQALIRLGCHMDAALHARIGKVWVLMGRGQVTGMRASIAIPPVDEIGRPIAAGFVERPLESESGRFSDILARLSGL